MMRKNAFFFDIIFPSIRTNHNWQDSAGPTVYVRFQEYCIKLSSRNCNVIDFEDKPDLDIFVGLQELKHMLTATHIRFTVKDDDRLVGTGKTTWPYRTLRQINRDMKEIFHVGECELKRHGKKAGKLEFIMRVRKKITRLETPPIPKQMRIPEKYKPSARSTDQILNKNTYKHKVRFEGGCEKPTKLKQQKSQKPDKRNKNSCSSYGHMQNNFSCSCNGNQTCCYCLRKKILENMRTEPIITEAKTTSSSVRVCPSARPFVNRVLAEMCSVYENSDEYKRELLTENILRTLNEFTKNPKTCKRKKETKNIKLCYYPRTPLFQGIHKHCTPHKRPVPGNMGWLWTKDARPNWKPGIIDKRIRKIMRHFQQIHPTTTLEAQRLVHKEITKICKESKVLPTTMRVCKQADAYFITLNTEANSAKIPCQPFNIKISKHPKLILYRQLKRQFKDMGFKKCTCHKPISKCSCRSYVDQKRLQFEVERECCRRQIPCVNDDLVLSDTSLSEADIEFDVTSPVQLAKPQCKKIVMLSNSTQCIREDYAKPDPQIPAINRLLESYDCTVGEKYGKPNFDALTGMDWREAQLAVRRAKSDAQRDILLNQTNSKKMNNIEPAWGKNGPPGGFSADGIPLDEFGLPYCDADGYYLDALGMRTGKQKRKPVNMMKYLTKHGLFEGEDLNPEYLAKMHQMRQDFLKSLKEKTPEFCCADRPPQHAGTPCQCICYNHNNF